MDDIEPEEQRDLEAGLFDRDALQAVHFRRIGHEQ
ncbi:hypothetical protein HNO88_002095 [Novosphingobium chloroacetimidivorans]|uniref:Uncharacterized protein n=1 Tax=Novosphingobium chloroacetimidivorans TaxID=1428314 RepID=A0A7W7NWT8_9SPHN|nr:hypothetical protein [Novosphingobium chloroacetimidivorans]